MATAIPRILFGAFGFGIAEKHQHRVADEFVDVRAMSEHDLRHCREISVQHRRQIFRLHVGGGRGEILDVAEEHRQPLAFGGELHVARTGEDRGIDLGREVFGELDREALQHPGLFVEGRVALLDLLQGIAQQQVGVHTRAHDGGVERLVDVIDRAELEPLSLILGFGPGGQKDHRNGRGLRIGLEPPTDLVAIHVGHRHVEQDQVRLVGRAGMFERLGATGRHPGAILILQDGECGGDVGRRVVEWPPIVDRAPLISWPRR
jgi:hypothetical protein